MSEEKITDPELAEKIRDAKQRLVDFQAFPEIVQVAEDFLKEHGETLAKPKAKKA